MCFICDKHIFVHMSHAQQRQSTVIQKKERKEKKNQKKPFLGKLLSKKSIKVFDIKCACSAGIIVVLLQITFSLLQEHLSFIFAGTPFKCEFILSVCIWFWFAYLLILVRVLLPLPKGVRGDWIEIDRHWWTNAFFAFECSTIVS